MYTKKGYCSPRICPSCQITGVSSISHHLLIGVRKYILKFGLKFLGGFCFVLFLVALGFEFRASHLLGRHSYHLGHSASPILKFGIKKD
jgi:hypothetical protein